jgi:hypothetical protein
VKATPTLEHSQSVGLAKVAHQLVQFLAWCVDVSPEVVFLHIGKTVLAAELAGYQYESLAAHLIVQIAER